MPDDEKPMRWPDLMGFAPEITGGRSIEEYLNDARGDGYCCDICRREETNMTRPEAGSPSVPTTQGERTCYCVPDGPKMLRETLCVAQSGIGALTREGVKSAGGSMQTHMDRLQHLIDECDRHRPIGPDGKHGNRHTPTCGCEDKDRPCDHNCAVIVSDEDYERSQGVCAGCGVRMKNDAKRGWEATP